MLLRALLNGGIYRSFLFICARTRIFAGISAVYGRLWPIVNRSLYAHIAKARWNNFIRGRLDALLWFTLLINSFTNVSVTIQTMYTMYISRILFYLTHCRHPHVNFSANEHTFKRALHGYTLISMEGGGGMLRGGIVDGRFTSYIVVNWFANSGNWYYL